MSEGTLQFTLREMRVIAMRWQNWLVLGVVAFVLGLAGPFGTYEFSVGARVAYWIATVLLTYFAGSLVITYVSKWLSSVMNKWAVLPIAALAGAVPVTLVVAGLNLLAFEATNGGIELPTLFGYCTAITLGVTLVSYVRVQGGAENASGSHSVSSAPSPAILLRVPHHKRGALVSLSVQDHYVEIETLRGSELVLMRLTDAMRETAGSAGLQIHRSHWVALDGVKAVRRESGKPVVETISGKVLPISRSYLAAAREAGLIV